MRHPSDGVLRRLVDDQPAAVTEADRSHVATCGRCRDALVAISADADSVAAAIGADVAVDVDAAWRRLSASSSVPPRPVAAGPRLRSWSLLRRPAAVVAFAVVLSGAGVAAANDWLPIFRTERVAPVSLSTADLVALPDLSRYGAVTVVSEPEVHEVADAAAAAIETGIEVPSVATLPRGVRGAPTVQVWTRAVTAFTFSTERAARAAAAGGASLPTPPPGLDGSSVRLDAGPGVAQIWSSDSGVPALVVGRAVAPTAYSTGVPFETLRDYLLGLPGLPPRVAAQLRAFAGDGSTLPIPVPADRFRTSTTTVGGAEATLLSSRDATMAAVVWVSRGRVTLVAGSLDEDEVLSVARALR